MVFDALNVSLVASDAISGALRSIARSAGSAGNAAAEAGVEFGSFESALDEVSDEAIGLVAGNEAVAASIDEVDDEAAEAAATAGVFSRALGGIADKAPAAVIANSRVANSIDDVGDEATEAAGKLAVLRAALAVATPSVGGLTDATDGLSDAIGGLSATLGPFSGRLKRIGILAGALSAPVGGVISALGGVASAAAGAAGGLGLLAFAGLQKEAEELAASSDDLADSGEALEQILSNVKQAAIDALAPLQTAANAEFALAGLAGVVTLIEDAAEVTAEFAPVLRSLGTEVGADVLAAVPAILRELLVTTDRLSPLLTDLSGALRSLPGAIAFLRGEAAQLAPELGSVSVSFLRAAAGVSKLGTDLLDVLLPPLAITLDLIGFLANALAAIPQPVVVASVAFIGLAAAYSLASVAGGALLTVTSALAGILGTLFAPITVTVGAILALVAATAAIIEAFGLWDDIVGAFVAGWNSFIGAIETGINLLFDLYDALGVLGPILMPGIAVLQNFDAVVRMVGEALDTLASIADDVFSAIETRLARFAERLSFVVDLIDLATDAAGLDGEMTMSEGAASTEADLSALKAGERGDDSDQGASGPQRGGGAARRRAPGAGQTTVNNYDFSGADFGGEKGREKTAIQKAVREANREDRAREDGRGG